MTEFSPPDPLEQKLADLEIRLAHFERMTDDLSDILMRQERIIDRLSLALSRMGDRLLDLEQGGGASLQDEKPPPHY